MRKKWALQFLLVALVKAIVLSGSIIITQVIARLYGAETLGYFATAMAAVMFLSIIFHYGGDVVIARTFVRQKKSNIKDIYFSLQKGIILHKWKNVLVIVIFIFILLYFYIYAEKVILYYILLAPITILWALMLLRNHYLKLTGNKIRSAWHEVGLLNIFISMIVLFCYPICKNGFLAPLSIAGGLLYVFTILWILVIIGRKEHGVFPPDMASWRNQSLAMSLLNFLARNGYLIIFPLFISSTEIGFFRLEERLAFMLFFIYSLFETLIIREYVLRIRESRGADLVRAFWGYVMRIQPFVLAATLIASLAVQFEIVRELAHIVSPGRLQWLLFMAMPLQIQMVINMLFINLRGHIGFNIANSGLNLSLFILLSYWLHAEMGLDGLRMAFFITAAAGMIMTFIPVVFIIRHDDHSPIDKVEQPQ